MCGIAGILNYTDLRQDSADILKHMLARIQYRGPDESGILIDDQVALGNVRLSIIDISTGQQPLSTPDGNLWIVFNGEIFNFPELRNDLEKSGHVFRTKSDTEVLLHAFQQYGTSCFSMLNGQFALAIWNRASRELILARDRVGIRPLFYCQQGKHFIFGSEIKSIAEFPEVHPVFDPDSLLQIATFWTAISPKTAFRNIFEVPPGSFMVISEKGRLTKCWWKLSFPSNEDAYFKGSLHEASEHLKGLLTDAVRLRLRADVPVAAYLSGGIDSSVTTALIKDVEPDVLQTFSIGFEDREYDETHYQKLVADHLKTRHVMFSCTGEEIGTQFPRVVWHSETPLLRTAPVPMYCLSERVRKHGIKVVITGEGADEMLAGYDIFKEAIIREFWSRQPDSRLRPLLLNKLYPYLAQFQDKNKSLLKFFYGYKLTDTASPFYSHLIRWHNADHLTSYFSEDLKSAFRNGNPANELLSRLEDDFSTWSRLGKAQWLEIMLFMSGYLLAAQGDRVAMANSVEGRYPFLDYRVMEFSASLPPEFKMHGLNEKFILKRMMQHVLPAEILSRPKQAYRAPISGSFFSSSHHIYVNELLSKKGVEQTGLFSFEKVNRLVTKIKQSGTSTEVENMALCSILSTQLLYHQFVLMDSYKMELPGLSNLKTCINLSKSRMYG